MPICCCVRSNRIQMLGLKNFISYPFCRPHSAEKLSSRSSLYCQRRRSSPGQPSLSWDCSPQTAAPSSGILGWLFYRMSAGNLIMVFAKQCQTCEYLRLFYFQVWPNLLISMSIVSVFRIYLDYPATSGLLRGFIWILIGINQGV